MFNVSKAFLPRMLERRAGVIVNMASVGGVIGISRSPRVCTTKFAVVGMTKSMALDHAAAGVRINCICPGRVETPFVARGCASILTRNAPTGRWPSTQAVGRMGRPEEIASAALYLASDEAVFVTGSALMIDGGWKG